MDDQERYEAGSLELSRWNDVELLAHACHQSYIQEFGQAICLHFSRRDKSEVQQSMLETVFQCSTTVGQRTRPPRELSVRHRNARLIVSVEIAHNVNEHRVQQCLRPFHCDI